MKRIINQLVEMLRSAPRQGVAVDIPEGSRYIIISDTLANELVDKLERLNG